MRRPTRSTTFLLFAACTALNLLGWRTSVRLGAAHDFASLAPSGSSGAGLARLARRSWTNETEWEADWDWSGGDVSVLKKKECPALPSPEDKDLCRWTRTHCVPPGQTPYLPMYYCAPKPARPFVFAGGLVWMAFLFATIGIVASDFFCPNLSTIAHRLGLNESVAGATLLAFGNGSPDVFSTFSAMKAGSGSLAIGELLGAGSFIVSVVAGSMSLVKPFRAQPFPFLRDVGFFTVSVAFLLGILIDGQIEVWEGAGLVGLYVAYVGVVVVGTWWVERRARMKERERTVRGEYGERYRDELVGGDGEEAEGRDEEVNPFFMNPSPFTHLAPPSASSPSLSPHPTPPLPSPSPSFAYSFRSPTSSRASSPTRRLAGAPHLSPSTPAARSRRRAHSLAASPAGGAGEAPRHSFSLLGAIEFRDVVHSLQREHSAARGLGVFHTAEDGLPIFSGGHYHPHQHPHLMRRAKSHSGNTSAPQSPTVHTAPVFTAHGRRRGRSLVGGGVDTRSGSAGGVVEGTGAGALIDLGEPPVADPWKDASSPLVPFPASSPTTSPEPCPTLPRLDIPARAHSPSPVPSIHILDESGAPISAPSPPPPPPRSPAPPSSSSSRWRSALKMAWHILFPTLQDFRHKSLVGRVLAVFAAPAVLALTLTLPVVDDETDEEAAAGAWGEGKIALQEEDNDEEREEEDEDEDEPIDARPSAELHRLVRDGLPRRLSALTPPDEREEEADGQEEAVREEEQEEEEELAASLGWNKYLSAAQALFGSLLIGFALFSQTPYRNLVLALFCGAGLALAALILARGSDGRNPVARLARCFGGFTVSMVWIMLIADEVVLVLQALGLMFGLTDALIGLTIFAIGNSLADWVANLTVAAAGFPHMGFSACFGGPMLSILLARAGISSLYLVTVTGEPYVIDFSPTLLVSGAGLLLVLVATLVVVPYNRFYLGRKWGAALVCIYIAIMSTNIVVELHEVRRKK